MLNYVIHVSGIIYCVTYVFNRISFCWSKEVKKHATLSGMLLQDVVVPFDHLYAKRPRRSPFLRFGRPRMKRPL